MQKPGRLLACAAAITLTLGLAACDSGGGGADATTDPVESEFGGNLIVGPLPASIDPVATTQRVVGLVAANVCEGLFENTSTLAPGEGLVDTWEYDEDVTYTFQLREGVNFHDGTVLAAEDVVASLERYAASAPGATFGTLMAGVEATGPLEVTLTLTGPSAAVPALLSTPDSAAYIMPASIVKDRDPADALQLLVCTGPYQMDSYVPDQTVELSRFDDYTARTDPSDGATGEKIAYIDTITFIPTDASNAVNLLRTGGLNVQSQMPLDQVPSFASDPNVEATIIPNGGYPLLQLNTRAGLMANETLRQAVLAAVNAEEIMASVAPSAEFYTIDSSLMPPGSPWYSTEGSELYNQADPERSKQLQAQAGYNGEEITMIYQTVDAWAPVAVAQLTAAGFNITAIPTDGPTFTQRRGDPEQWDIFTSGGTSYGDPLTVVFMSPGFPGWWDTPEKQALMSEFLTGTTQEGRKATWDELQALIYEQVPFVRIGGRAQVDAISSNVVLEYPPFPGSARGFYNVVMGSGS